MLLLTYRAVSGSVRRRVWIATIRKTKLCKCGCHGRCTVNALFDIVAWMVEALVTRRWPCTDHERKAFGNHPYDRERKHNGESGKLLTRAGALLYKCADWAWLKQFCGCKGWQGITSQRLMCWLCAAGLVGRHDAYDCFADATWRQHMISMHKFWAENPHGNLFHIWKILGMDIGRILPDWMHVVCLGILQAVQCNVMWHLFKKRLSGTFKNPAVARTKLMNMMKFSAAILGVEKPFNKLSMGMIRSSSTHKPKLKLKAAEGRHFLPVLIHMMQSLFGILNPYEQMMVHCLQALQNCYVLLDANPWDPTCKLRLGRYGRQHLEMYKELSRQSPPLLFHFYPKHHLFINIVENAFVSPKLMWNYGDEDEIGRCAKLAKTVHYNYLEVALIKKYRLCFKI